MANTVLKIEGLKELEDALRELPKATAKNTIRRALAAASIPIADQAQSLIVVRRVKPAIVATKVKFSSGAAGKRAFAEALARGATRGEAGEAARQANRETSDDATTTSGVLSIGPTKRAFYGFEFGTVRQAPQPFMRPSWDSNKLNALEIIKTELKDQIEKARARLARKAARAAS